MAFRLYVVPVVGTGSSSHDPRRPKYFADGGISPAPNFSALDYGFEPTMIVGANLSVADDAFVVAQPDVIAFPFDLSPTLTAGQVTATRNALEALHLPAGWVTTALTWRTVARTVLGIFQFVSTYGVVYANANGVAAPSLFIGGMTLDTTFGSYPALVQSAMIATAQSLNISTAGLTAGTTMRVILKAMADTFQGRSFDFGGGNLI